MRSLGARLLVIPGNHDDRRLLRSSLLGLPAGDDPMDSVLHVGDLRVIGLDSSVPDGDHGELDDEQLDWLSRELLQPAPAGTILVIHHPPIWSTTPVSELVALRAPERLADAIRGRDVRLILSGHTHRVSAGTLTDVPVWVSPATASNADSLASGDSRGHAAGASHASTSLTMARSSPRSSRSPVATKSSTTWPLTTSAHKRQRECQRQHRCAIMGRC